MQFEFVKANIMDFDAVFAMMERAKAKSYEEGVFQWDNKYPNANTFYTDINNSNLYLVKGGQNLVGFFVYNRSCEDELHNNIQWRYPSGKWVFLHRICIDPIYQSRGYGQIIIDKFISKIRQANYHSIRLDVFSTNRVAIHIYEKFGFKRVGVCQCYRGSFYVYEKRL